MRGIFSLLLCMSSYVMFCQESQLAYQEIKGVLFDSLTREPIPAAHLVTRHFSISSNPDGSFSILVLPGDSIQISHVSYYTEVIQLNTIKNSSNVKIALKQKVTLLESVTVSPILSEDKFKAKILETEPVELPEEQNAKANIAVLNYYIKSLPQLPMSAGENYREYLKGPQGVTLFSTGGQKGLIKAIRNVIKERPIEYKSFPNKRETIHHSNFHIFKDSSHQTNKIQPDSLSQSQMLHQKR